jgi:hypothetical protein
VLATLGEVQRNLPVNAAVRRLFDGEVRRPVPWSKSASFVCGVSPMRGEKIGEPSLRLMSGGPLSRKDFV